MFKLKIKDCCEAVPEIKIELIKFIDSELNDDMIQKRKTYFDLPYMTVERLNEINKKWKEKDEIEIHLTDMKPGECGIVTKSYNYRREGDLILCLKRVDYPNERTFINISKAENISKDCMLCSDYVRLVNIDISIKIENIVKSR